MSDTNNNGNSTKFVLPKSTGILLVVFCAVLGYAITFRIILSDIIQYSKLPKSLLIAVPNGANNNDLIKFSLPVKSQLSIDTVHSIATNDYVKNIGGNILFHENPSFLLWAFLLSAMVSIASGSVPFFISQIVELKNKFKLNWWKVLIGGIFYAILMDSFLIGTNHLTIGYYQPSKIINDFHILFNNGKIIDLFVLSILILIIPGLATMFLIGASSDKIYFNAERNVKDSNTSSKDAIEEAVKRIKYLNQLLQSTLQILATIVVFSVLTSSTLGESIKSMVSVSGLDLFPKQISYIYGMYFSLFLCVIYIPIYYYLKNNFNRLKELASDPVNIPNSSVWYTSLFGDVKFEGSALENVKLALTIIAPILTAFLPKTLDFMK